MTPQIIENWTKLRTTWFMGNEVAYYRHKRSPDLFVAMSDDVPDLFVQAHSAAALDRKTQDHFVERRRKASQPGG